MSRNVQKLQRSIERLGIYIDKLYNVREYRKNICILIYTTYYVINIICAANTSVKNKDHQNTERFYDNVRNCRGNICKCCKNFRSKTY